MFGEYIKVKIKHGARAVTQDIAAAHLVFVVAVAAPPQVSDHPAGAVILDGYSRAFAIDFSRSLRSAQVAPRLTAALSGRTRNLAAGSDAVGVAFTIDGSGGGLGGGRWIAPLRLGREDAMAAKVLAARVTARLAPDKQFGFAFRQGADGLTAQLQGARSPAFLVAGAPGEDLGFVAADRTALAFRQTLEAFGGGFGLTLSAESGEALLAPQRFATSLRARREAEPVQRFGAALDTRLGPIEGALGLSWLGEDRTVLGARFHPAFGRSGADSLMLDARAGWSFAPGWNAGAAWRGGYTRARSGGALVGGRLLSSAFALDLEKVGVLAGGDALALRFSQPLRVERGGVRLNLPVDYDYATLATTYGESFFPLTPNGRELMGELAWRGSLWGGEAAGSVFYRKDPEHFATGPDDQGIAVKWSRGF